MLRLEIYTDGAAQGNPGNGGYGIVLKFGDKLKKLNQGFRKTTNNRMELLAVIVALENVKSSKYPIHVYSDSKYVVDAIEKKWLDGWIKKNFKGRANIDLWKRYIEASKGYSIKFHWVKGHDGHYYNEMCDQLAVQAAESKDLLVDEGYESEN